MLNVRRKILWINNLMEVIILAGGLGTRLRSVVNMVPKCMAPVAGKPFLWYILKYLTKYNVTHVILSVGYLREVIYKWIDEVKMSFLLSLIMQLKKLLLVQVVVLDWHYSNLWQMR